MSSILALRAYGSDSNDSEGEDEDALTAHLKPIVPSESPASVQSSLQVCLAPAVTPKVSCFHYLDSKGTLS